MVTRVLIIAALVAAAGGCDKRSEKYCGLHPDDLANCEQTDAPPPAKVQCTNDSQCSTGHCELKAQLCVDCLANSDCTGGELCDVGGTYTCKGCIRDGDCPSNACLPGGVCGQDSTVVYVDAGGTDNATCSTEMPCKTIAHGLTLVTANRKYMRVTGELAESPTIDVDVEILGDGARLTGASGVDWVIKVASAVVKIHGVEVFCAGGTDTVGINAGASTLTLDQVDVSGCGRGGGGIKLGMGFAIITRSVIHDNPAGGITTDGKANFTITNNILHHNGTAASPGGGVIFGADSLRPETKFEFNTVVDNDAMASKGAGAQCAKAIPMANNLFVSNGTILSANVVGCDPAGALVTDDLASVHFLDEAQRNYHITPPSVAIDMAPDGSNVDDDIDGELRPQGASMKKDYGADEYRAP
jgi:hypothetical protein